MFKRTIIYKCSRLYKQYFTYLDNKQNQGKLATNIDEVDLKGKGKRKRSTTFKLVDI